MVKQSTREGLIELRKRLDREIKKRKPPMRKKFIPRQEQRERLPQNEWEKAIWDVQKGSEQTVDVGFNESRSVLVSAGNTLGQADREIQLINDLLEGRL